MKNMVNLEIQRSSPESVKAMHLSAASEMFPLLVSLYYHCCRWYSASTWQAVI